MGKATITSAIADGEYNVMVNFDRSRSDAEIADLQAENTAIATRLTELAAEINTASLDVDYAREVLKAKITALKQAKIDGPERVAAAKQAWDDSIAEYTQIPTTAEQAEIDTAQANYDALVAAGASEAEITAAKNTLDALIAEYTAPDAYGQSQIDAAKAAYEAVKDEVQNAEKHVKEATDNVIAAQNILMNLITVKNIARLKKLANEKRIGWLQQNVVDDINTTAWCADFNTALTGAVGLIEVGRHQGSNIIKPGGADGSQAGYNGAVDGKYEPYPSSTPAGAFYNLAIAPGVEKWKPRYRSGTITAMTGGLCDITLDAATNALQNININQNSTLTAVPVQYMTCNAAAFTVGDHVVIEFVGQNWAAPQVVGFVDHPKPCTAHGITCINPSDTPHGSQPSSTLDYTTDWVARQFTPPSGTIDWSLGAQVVSWRASHGRYSNTGTYSSSIYIDGVRSLVAPAAVLGAALMTSGADTYCNIICGGVAGAIDLYQKKYTGVDTDPGLYSDPDKLTGWQLLASYTAADASALEGLYPYHFDAAGTESSSVAPITPPAGTFVTLIRIDWSAGAAVVTDEGAAPPGGYGSTSNPYAVVRQHCELDAPPVASYDETVNNLYRSLLYVDYTAAGRVTAWQETAETATIAMSGHYDASIFSYTVTWAETRSGSITLKTSLGDSALINQWSTDISYSDDPIAGTPTTYDNIKTLISGDILAADIRYGLFAVYNKTTTITSHSSAPDINGTITGDTVTDTSESVTLDGATLAVIPLSSVTTSALTFPTWLNPLDYFYTCYDSYSDGNTSGDNGDTPYLDSSVAAAMQAQMTGGLGALSTGHYLFARELTLGGFAAESILKISASGDSLALLGISSAAADNPTILAVGII